jgi:zinc transporter 1/2/3
MIGVSLGASGGEQWKPLFIAIIFHQMFEGLALGSRIGMLIWPAGQGWRKWTMAGAFGVRLPFPFFLPLSLLFSSSFSLYSSH